MLEAFSAAQLDGWFGPENAKVARAVARLPLPLAEAPGDGLLDGFAAIHEGRTADGYALLRQGIRSMAAAYDSRDSTLPRVLAWLQEFTLLAAADPEANRGQAPAHDSLPLDETQKQFDWLREV